MYVINQQKSARSMLPLDLHVGAAWSAGATNCTITYIYITPYQSFVLFTMVFSKCT